MRPLVREPYFSDKEKFQISVILYWLGVLVNTPFGEDGKEVTINFFTEEQSVVMFKSYKQKVPSDYFLSCVEDSTLLVGDLESEENMYEKSRNLRK